MFNKNNFRAHKRFSALLGIGAFILIAGVLVLVQAFQKDSVSGGIKNTTISVQGGPVNTPDVLATSSSQKQIKYSSPTFKATYEFNAIAPQWKESNATETSRKVSIRTSIDDRTWSDWMEIHAMRPQKDDAPFDGEVFPEAPLIMIGKFFQYKVELEQQGDKPTAVEDMSVTYIDSRTPSKKVGASIRSLLSPKAYAVSTKPNVISRAAWGSPDPTGSAFKGSDRYWDPTYKATSQIFIHHTVTSDYASQTDGASVVRAVWEYHANTRGWGDIGYNYLVDQAGNIYEGRAHGDNVTGGHVYEYNTGSSGVALLGCFHSPDSTCKEINSNLNPPSSAMLESLTTLLAWMTSRFEIDPQAQHTFCKYNDTGCLTLNTITGHRDANVTSCPGDLTLNVLQSIRDTTASKKTTGFTYSAKQVNYPTVSLGDNNELSVTLQYKNTGTATWYNSGANILYLATANSIDHTSVFQGTGWISNTRPAKLTEASVPPGSTGSFTFNVANPTGYLDDWHEYFGLVAEGSTHFGNFFSLPIITRSYSYSYLSQQSYKDNTKLAGIDLTALSPGQTAWLVLKVTNTSNVTWSNTGFRPVYLGTDSSRDRHSRFCTSGWLSCGRPAKLLEASIAPGAIGTFEFPIQVPAGGGSFNEYFTPLVESAKWMDSVGIHYTLSVNNSYAWDFVSQAAFTDSSKSNPVDLNNLSPGQTFFYSITAKNTGNTTWYNSGPHPSRLGTYRPHDRGSIFYHSSWVLPNRVSRMTEQSVSPGQNGTFEGVFTTPPTGGSIKEYLQPVVEGITWLNDLGSHIPITVRVSYSWDFAGQQAFTDSSQTTPVDLNNLTPGQRFYFVVSAKNTGTATWYNSSTYPLRLGTANPKDRASLFYDNSWLASTRPVALTESSVPPGSVGRFGGYYTAPSQKGTYKEYLQPVAESITWLNDLGLHIPAEVK